MIIKVVEIRVGREEEEQDERIEQKPQKGFHILSFCQTFVMGGVEIRFWFMILRLFSNKVKQKD